MNVSELEPQKVYHFFEKIASIPHGSGHTAALSDYCLEFAKERGLNAKRDAGGNVVIYKEGTDGYEALPPVILQGHLDMVLDQTSDCKKDLTKEGLSLLTDGDWLFADGTSLGADDGIAVAYALAILDSDTIPHPPLEVLLTADEEVGMKGASALDASMLHGCRLINLDSEEEGILTVSCAGGVRAYATLTFSDRKSTDSSNLNEPDVLHLSDDVVAIASAVAPSTDIVKSPGDAVSELPANEFVRLDENSFTTYRITLRGLQGGHSGVEIHKPRINAILGLAEFLSLLQEEQEFQISAFQGGTKDNAIPKQADAEILIPDGTEDNFSVSFETVRKNFLSLIRQDEPEAELVLQELHVSGPDMQTASTTLTNSDSPAVSDTQLASATSVDSNSQLGSDPQSSPDTSSPLSIHDSRIFTEFLLGLPNGVREMSPSIPDMVQTSSNLGVASLKAGEVHLSCLLRSNSDHSKELLKENLKTSVSAFGGTTSFQADYPAWEYREDSPLRTQMVRTYTELFSEEPVVTAIHAGLECALLAQQFEDMDMVSFGPTLEGVHTSDERMNVASAARCWDYLLHILKNLKG